MTNPTPTTARLTWTAPTTDGGDSNIAYTIHRSTDGTTWGAPYDPHAYASGWIAKDESHFQALAGLEAPRGVIELLNQTTDNILSEYEKELTRIAALGIPDSGVKGSPSDFILSNTVFIGR